MLIDDFFEISGFDPQKSVFQFNIEVIYNYKATIIINPAHRIFEGHFPENPVVPGVTLIEIVKETLENYIGKELQLKSTGNVKFLHVVNPQIETELMLDYQVKFLNDDEIQAKSTIYSKEIVVLKFDGTFIAR
jgi:3-hydroxyacyl-[acyl-carrier-protein] dehydratase